MFYNSMAKGMTERYEEYLNTVNLEERAAKSIYYFVMSTAEFLFWASGHKAQWSLNFFASEEKMYLVFHDDKYGSEHEIIYVPTENCSNGNLSVIVQKFVDIFNDIKYPLAQKISSPTFCAHYSGKRWENNDKYNGYYFVYISLDMRPDANNG